MSVFRFIHTSDLHLGKGFGSMPEELRGRLIEARHEAITRLATAARDRGAAHVLVAGDTFDTASPSERVRRQAATAMSAAADIQWWILPGNHDSLTGEDLWTRFQDESADNVHVLRLSEPVQIAPGVHLLPAPLPRQFPGSDLTAWMVQAETPEGDLRIGLAHGGVVSFGQDFDSSALIPPDRASTARLDYLALGDWHGRLEITPRTGYCGTPERDRFKHDGPGVCLSVTLAGPGADPVIEEVPIGRFDWCALQLPLNPEMDAVAELDRLLPPDRMARRDILLQLRPTGYLRMEARGEFDDHLRLVTPDFAHLDLRGQDLATDYEITDLDLIASGGALRTAAEDLWQEASGTDASAEEMRVAQAALNRLWSMMKED